MLHLIERASSRNSSVWLFRTRLVRAGWVVVRRSDGLRRSIPIYRRRAVPIAKSRGRR
jgi:hypothetical protein